MTWKLVPESSPVCPATVAFKCSLYVAVDKTSISQHLLSPVPILTDNHMAHYLNVTLSLRFFSTALSKIDLPLYHPPDRPIFT